jgi:hypothetical protein
LSTSNPEPGFFLGPNWCILVHFCAFGRIRSLLHITGSSLIQATLGSHAHGLSQLRHSSRYTATTMRASAFRGLFRSKGLSLERCYPVPALHFSLEYRHALSEGMRDFVTLIEFNGNLTIPGKYCMLKNFCSAIF